MGCRSWSGKTRLSTCARANDSAERHTLLGDNEQRCLTVALESCSSFVRGMGRLSTAPTCIGFCSVPFVYLMAGIARRLSCLYFCPPRIRSFPRTTSSFARGFGPPLVRHLVDIFRARHPC